MDRPMASQPLEGMELRGAGEGVLGLTTEVAPQLIVFDQEQLFRV